MRFTFSPLVKAADNAKGEQQAAPPLRQNGTSVKGAVHDHGSKGQAPQGKNEAQGKRKGLSSEKAFFIPRQEKEKEAEVARCSPEVANYCSLLPNGIR